MVWQLVPPFHVGLAAKTKWGIGPLRILVSIIAALIGLTGAEEALAQSAYAPSGFEIRGGVLAHDVPGLWSGFRLESGVDINAELLGPGVAFLGGTLRPAIGGSVNTAGYTSKAYLDARWEIDLRYGVFFGLGLGAAIHDGNLDHHRIDRLRRAQSISVYFEHMSNGNLPTREALDASAHARHQPSRADEALELRRSLVPHRRSRTAAYRRDPSQPSGSLCTSGHMSTRHVSPITARTS